jgi:hypothetical protein
MSEEYRPLPFRWILPVAQLLLCVAILWPLRNMLIREIRLSAEAYRTHGASLKSRDLPSYADESRTGDRAGIQVRVIDPDLLPPGTSWKNPERIPVTLRLWGPALLNFPSASVELPISLADPNGRFWVPSGMGLPSWRAISWPLIGLVLWWVVGRGFEALLAAIHGIVRPRITWAEILFAAAITLLGAFALLAPVVEEIRNDPELPWVFLSLAGMLWLILGTTIIMARVLQRRIRRRIARQTDATPAPA